MPELSRFEGMEIKMPYKDHRRHHKPHIHVYYGDVVASVGIDGELLAGSLPAKKFLLLRAWLVLHEDELYGAWNKTIEGIPPDKIDPLR